MLCKCKGGVSVQRILYIYFKDSRGLWHSLAYPGIRCHMLTHTKIIFKRVNKKCMAYFNRRYAHA